MSDWLNCESLNGEPETADYADCAVMGKGKVNEPCAGSASSRFRVQSSAFGAPFKVSGLKFKVLRIHPHPLPSPIRRARGINQGLVELVPPTLRRDGGHRPPLQQNPNQEKSNLIEVNLG